MEERMDEGQWKQLNELVIRAKQQDRQRLVALLNQNEIVVLSINAGSVLSERSDDDGRFERWAEPSRRLEPGQVVVTGRYTSTATDASSEPISASPGYVRCSTCGTQYDDKYDHHHRIDDHLGIKHNIHGDPGAVVKSLSDRHAHWCPTQSNPHNGCTCGGIFASY